MAKDEKSFRKKQSCSKMGSRELCAYCTCCVLVGETKIHFDILDRIP
jgi:hypothetical protein